MLFIKVAFIHISNYSMPNNKKGAKRILILGGEGFIGRNLCETLSRQHDCFSMGLEKSIFPGRTGVFMQGNPYKKKVKDFYDVFIHLIDNPVSEKEFKSEETKLIENIGARKSSHLIVFSSAVIYANPESDYGKRKKIFEEFYAEYCMANGINLTIFRLFNIFGKYQLPYRQGSLVANIFLNYLNGKTTEINDLEVKRDFIFARDMAKIVEYVISNNIFAKTDLGSGKLVSIEEMIKAIENTVNKRMAIKNMNNKERLVCPEAKIDQLKGKVSMTPLESGLQETFKFYRKNLKLINSFLSI